MPDQTSSDAPARYADYLRAVDALREVPTRLSAGLAEADAAAATAHAAADREREAATTRLAGLRRSTQSRYADVAEALRAHGVLVPAQVRGDTVAAADEDALRRAVEAQRRAIVDVDAAIREARRTAEREKTAAASRAAAGQQAASALRARQERIRAEQEAAAAASAAEEAAAARRHARLRFVYTAAAALVVSAVIVVVILILTRH